MSALAAFQRRFMASLLDAADGDAAATWGPGFGVYRRGVAANALGALAATYPVVRRLVGEAFFAEAASRFRREQPSQSADLHRLGTGFDRFLAGYAPARAVPVLPCMARLEWALHECRIAGDGRGEGFAALAALDPARQERMRLRLHPAARLVESAHPILAIWEANQPGGDGVPTEAPGPDRLLVHRQGLEPRATRLGPGEWSIASAIASGVPLGRLVASLDDEGAGGFADALVRLETLGAFDGWEAAPA